MSTLSEKQRAWLKKLGAVVNSGDGGGAEVAEPPPRMIIVHAESVRRAPTQPGGQGAQKVPAAGAPGEKAAAGNKSDLVGIGIPGILDPSITVKVTIINRSPFDLERASGSAKLENPTVCKFTKPPPAELPANGPAQTFEISNNSVPGFGCGGEVSYNIVDDDKKTSVFIKWERGFIPSRKHTEEVRPAYAAKFSVSGDFVDDEFTYIFSGKGGPGPKPGPQPPGPQPGPAQDVKTSCNITVTNNTKLVLTLADQGHDRGDFMTFPPQTIQPGASAQFVSVETPHGKEQGCKGFVSWEVGSPSAAIWRCEWDNPEGDKNTAKAPAEPQSAGFRTVAQIGQDDENVPVAFTISGGGGDGPGPGPGPGPKPGPGPEPPGPKPEPKPEPEPKFDAPPGSRQPTLRKGDKSPDGWVEYLQTLLNAHLGKGTVDVDGSFGQKTHTAVLKFQQQKKLQVDGTVGNQTWAALRLEKAEAPSTDGRTPHTFEQKDLQARWEVNDTPDALYRTSKDLLELNVVNVGEGKIDDFFATIRVTPPGTPSKTVKVKIGPPFKRNKDDQGNLHSVEIENFKKNFPAKDPNAKMEDYLIEAFFDKELGPDLFKGHILVG